MSKKSSTVLTLAVRIRVPAGHTQQQALIWVLGQLVETAPGLSTKAFYSNETQVKIVKREVTYL